MRTPNSESYKNKNPFFIGTVEDNNDPDFNYRVKVRIPNIHPANISSANLPWAAKLDNSFMGIGDEQDITHSIPEVGSKVLILAIENDINSLVYLGVLKKKTPQTPSNEEYLSNYGIYRKDGQFIGVNKIKKLFQLLFDGDIEINQARNFTMTIKSEVNINCSTANVKASNKVNVTSPTSSFFGNIDCSGSIHASGAISSDSDCISGGISGKGHIHMVPQASSGILPSDVPM